MASVTFEFPDTRRDLIVGAFCRQYGYTPMVPNPEPRPEEPGRDATDAENDAFEVWKPLVPNPQTPGEFATARIVDFVSEVARADVLNQARAAAEKQAVADADAIIAATRSALTIKTE